MLIFATRGLIFISMLHGKIMSYSVLPAAHSLSVAAANFCFFHVIISLQTSSVSVLCYAFI